jgi:protein-disulfide isomerase
VSVRNQVSAPPRVPAHSTREGDGIAVSDGPITVEAYIDFQCPFCRQFELSSGADLNTMAADGEIRLVYHPLGFLDGLSTTMYSSRAAASSGCADDLDRFVEYAHALFVNQPPEGGPGLTDADLVVIGESVGLPAAAFAKCVGAGTYLPWVAYVTERAIARGVSGTPSVYVAGNPVPANARTIAAAVQALSR